MTAIHALKDVHALMRLPDRVTDGLCPHRLASKAHAFELASGVILNPRHHNRTFYLPYTAARPVAAFTVGTRKAGFAASATWGASVATSAVRTDFLMMWAYHYCHIARFTDAQEPLGFVNTQRHARADHGQQQQRQQNIKDVLTYATLFGPLLLCLSECLFGTGALPPNDENAADDRQRIGLHMLHEPGNPDILCAQMERLRRYGLAGFLEAKLLQKTDDGRGWAACAWMTAAIIVRLLGMPGRMFNGLMLVAATSVGATLGVIYELIHQVFFRAKESSARLYGQAEIVPMQEAQQRQMAWANAQLLHLDDTQLPAHWWRSCGTFPLVGSPLRTTYGPN